MAEEIKIFAEKLWRERRASSIGLILGLVIGASILNFGFFSTLFVILCMVFGLMIGTRLDRGDFDEVADAVWRLPERFKH